MRQKNTHSFPQGYRRFFVGSFFIIATYLLLTHHAQASIIKPSNDLGLVGYWSMEDGRGATATDFSGNGNAGTLTGSGGSNNLPQWTTGRIGKALNFDGTDDYVGVGDKSALNVEGGLYTISAWIKIVTAPTSGNSAVIVAKGVGGSGGYGLQYVNNSGTFTFDLVKYGVVDQTVDQTLVTGSWYHIVAVQSAGQVEFFLNGASIGIFSNASAYNPASGQNFNIGMMGDGTSSPWNGYLDDVRIYNRALSAVEVTALYTQASIANVKNSSRGLVGLWSFNEMAGATAVDKTGQGANGTLLPVPTSISRVQFRHTYPGGSGASLAFSSSVTSGNLIIVTVSGSGGGSVSSLGDNCSNSYTQAASGAVGVTVSEVWYAYNVTGGTCTITVTSTMTDFGMSIFEYSGASTGDPLITTHVDLQKKAGTSFNFAVDGMIFVHWANEQGGADANGYGSGWAGIQHDTTHFDLQEENVSATAGSYTPSVGGLDQGSDVLIAVAFRGRNRPIWTAGKFGGGLRFDGADDYVSITPQRGLPAYSNNSSMSFSAWIKSSDTSGKTIYAEQNNSFGLFKVSDGNTTNRVNVTIRNSVDGATLLDQTGDTAVFDGTWHHIAYTDSRGNAKLYVDGVQDTADFSYTPSTTTITDNIWIGQNSSNNFFNGSLDDVRVYNRVLSGQEVGNLYNSSGEGFSVINASMNGVLTKGLVGLWSFNGPDMTNTTSTDRSGQGNDGALFGGPKRAIGVSGQALSFDGTDDYISVTDASSLKFGTAAMSISAWIKAPNTDQSREYIAKRVTGSPFTQYGIGVTAGDSFFNIAGKKIAMILIEDVGSTYRGAYTNSDVVDGNWHHVVGVATGSTILIYVDGVSVPVTVDKNSGSWPNTDNTQPLTIGFNGDAYFAGLLDDVRIYNRVLSATEVWQLYSFGR